MNIILVKVLATALAFSQVTTRPEAIKTQFDPAADQAEVTQLLQAGCGHMRKSFDIEQVNLDDLIATAMDDKGAISDEIKVLKGLSFPICMRFTGNSARASRWRIRRSIFRRLSRSITRR